MSVKNLDVSACFFSAEVCNVPFFNLSFEAAGMCILGSLPKPDLQLFCLYTCNITKELKKAVRGSRHRVTLGLVYFKHMIF